MRKTLYRFLRNVSLLNFITHKTIFFLEKFELYNSIYDSYIRSQVESLGNYPSELVFMVTDNCNANCIMCPNKRFRKGNTLPLSLHSKIVQEKRNREEIKEVIFTGGEPLMDPTVFDKIQITREALPDAKLLFFTNGALLHRKDNILKLLSANLHSITVSLDALTEEDYERVRINLSFQKLIDNIKELYKMKKKLRSNTLIRLSVLALKVNEKSHKKFFKKMKGHGDILEINNPHNFGGLADVDPKYAYKMHKRFACKYLWTRLTIPSDGTVSICGYDFLHRHVIGNTATFSIEEIWNHEEFKKARQHHLAKSFGDVAMCEDCTSHLLWWKDYIF